MGIEDVIFTDGRIESLEWRHGALEIRLIDYADQVIEISFTGAALENQIEIGFDISDWNIAKDGGLCRLILYDDEHSCVGELLFESAIVSLLTHDS